MKANDELKKKLFVLDQMLKRHKIEAEVNLETAQLRVGKVKMPWTQIAIYFVFPIILFVSMVFIHLSLDLGRVKMFKFIYAIPITLIAYGINIVLGNKGASKTSKTLTPEECVVVGKKQSVTVHKNEMADVKTVLHTDDPSGLEGEVFLHTTNGKKCLLFRIRDEKLNYLRDDLDKIQDTLKFLWQLD